MNNPIKFVDPDGKIWVDANNIINKRTGRLVNSKITVYEDRAETRAAKSDGAFTEIEAIAINIGHEIEHTTDENVKLQSEPPYVGEGVDIIEAAHREKEYKNNKPIIVKPLTDLRKL